MDLFADIPDEQPQKQSGSGLPDGYPAFTPSPDVSPKQEIQQHPSWAERVYHAASPYIPDHLKDYARESVRSLYEGPRNTAQNFARDTGKPTLEGMSGAASTALSLPVRSVFGSDAGFGTAVDAVMNPLTLNRWGDRAERYYNTKEQRFARENEGIVTPANAIMEGLLNQPYGVAGRMAAGNPRLSTQAELDAFRRKAAETNQASESARSVLDDQRGRDAPREAQPEPQKPSPTRGLFADIPDEPASEAAGAPHAGEMERPGEEPPSAPRHAYAIGDGETATDTARRFAERQRHKATVAEIMRLRAVFGANAYGDADLIPRLLTSPDAETRGIGTALRDVAGDFSRLKEGVNNGSIDPAWRDVTSRLPEAARLIADLREQGIVPSEYVAQNSEQLHPHVGEWVNLLHHEAWPGESARDRAAWTLRTFLREPLAQEGSAGNIAPVSPQEGFKAGAQTLHRMSRARVDERNAARPGWNLAQSIGERVGENSPAFETDPAWIKQATAHEPSERYLAGESVDAGRPYTIDDHAHDAAHEIIRQFENRLPLGVKIGVLRRVEPVIGVPDIVKGYYSNSPDFANYTRRNAIKSSAAMWDPDTGAIAISRYGTSGFKSLEDFRHGVESEIVHELGHAVSAFHLSSLERGALLRDANNIGILDIPFNLYAGLRLGRPADRYASGRPMRDMYDELYSDRQTAADRQYLIDEEAIAILTELYHHGVVDPKDLSPVSRDVLDGILNGKYARGAKQRARSRGGAVKATSPLH